jgi:uncharacterized membrane protein
MTSAVHLERDSHRVSLAGAAVLGFALGGFLDGILLHQVLQWHHFLSLLQGPEYRDIRVQILADGLFHVAVYLITALGLWLLWRRGSTRPADRILLGWAALGFGIWQFSDVVIFHWIIGIHRIRVDVPNPLLWDIGWLVVFGVPSLVLGTWLLRNSTTNHGGGSSRNVAAAALSLTALIAAPVAALPSQNGTTLVVFRPGISPAQSFAAAASIDARIVWSDASGGVLALEMPEGASQWPLFRNGALLVGRSGLIAGCAAWMRV